MKGLWSFLNERTYWAKQIKGRSYESINFGKKPLSNTNERSNELLKNERTSELLKSKGHIEQNKLKVLWSDLFWKNKLSNTNERSNELENERTNCPIWMKGLWSFLNERTYWAKQIKGLVKQSILKKYIGQYKWKV